ncbi:MAG: DnaD domain protein [Clostridiales bacterium]|nr:DnaD domain protein [Clostridiales bacterium]
MTERKSFVVYQDWKRLFKRLSKEQKGDIFDAMFDYQESGQPYDGDDVAVGVAFDAMQIVFDRDDEKYQEQCRRNAENGKKGGRPRKTAPVEEKPPAETGGSDELPPEPQKPNGFSENPLKPQKADNENDSDNENGNDNGNENDTVCLAAASPIPAESEAAAGKKEVCLAAEDGNGGCSGKSQEVGSSPAQTARQEPLTADNQETASWLADRCRAVTGISPDHAQQKTLADWYKKHGEEAVERLFDEAKAHNAQRFGYFSAIMRRWEKAGVPGGQAKNRPQRGPEPRRDPSPAETARQQAALEENQRQLEKLLSDTAWMEDVRGA